MLPLTSHRATALPNSLLAPYSVRFSYTQFLRH
nr:MAG TPA: hypothetical protein [Caudoviricetes sp.]